MIKTLARHWRAGWRDTFLLFREFAWQLLLYGLAMVGGGIAYFYLALQAGEPTRSLVEAIYAILMMSFLQSATDFPQTWYLQIFHFAMPLAALAILAQGLADFGVMLFNRRGRSKEWEMAVASTFVNHVVLVGLGHLGYRVVRQLEAMDQEVVAIELNPEEDLIANARALGVPVIQGDGSREATLRAAGIEKARVIMLCTQNDNANLQIAVKARSLNPTVQVVMRIFDDDFADALKRQFGFFALSATGMAAPVFASMAAGMDITQPISVEGQAFSLARFDVAPKSKLANKTVSAVEEEYRVSIVLLRHNSSSDFHPTGERVLKARDAVAVLGEPEQILRLAQDNKQ